MIPHFTGLWRTFLKSARQKRKLPLSSLSLRSDCFLFRCRRTGTGQSRPSRIGPGLFRRTELRAQGAHLPPCHERGLLFGICPISLRWFFEDPCPTLSPGSARKKAPPCGQTLSLAGILSCCVLSSRTPPRPPRPQMAFHMFSGIVRIPGA